MTLNIAIAYHSGYGHTQKLAEHVAKGAQGTGAQAHIIKVDEITDADWGTLDAADAIIFGSPTYMGSVSGPFEMFADATSKKWFTLAWKNKIAGGFTNSLSLSGDKLFTLQRFVILAMQHGMIWVGQAEPMTGQDQDNVNRIGSYIGPMAQSENAPADQTPPSGDLKTAELYGQRIADITKSIKK